MSRTHDWFNSAARSSPRPPPPPPPPPPRRPAEHVARFRAPIVTPPRLTPLRRSFSVSAASPTTPSRPPRPPPTPTPPSRLTLRPIPDLHRSLPDPPRASSLRPRRYSSPATDLGSPAEFQLRPSLVYNPPPNRPPILVRPRSSRSSLTGSPSRTPPPVTVHQSSDVRLLLWTVASALVLLLAYLASHVSSWQVHCIVLDNCPLTPSPLPNANCHTAWSALHAQLDSLARREIRDLISDTRVISELAREHPEESYLAVGDAVESVEELYKCPSLINDFIARTTLTACVPGRRIPQVISPEGSSPKLVLANTSRVQRASAAGFLQLCGSLSPLREEAHQRGTTDASSAFSLLLGRMTSFVTRETFCNLTFPLVSDTLLWADSWHTAQTCPWDRAMQHARAQQPHDDRIHALNRQQQQSIALTPPLQAHAPSPVRLATATQFTLAALRFEAHRIASMALLDSHNEMVILSSGGPYDFRLGLLPRTQINATRVHQLDDLLGRATKLSVVAAKALQAHVMFVKACDGPASDGERRESEGATERSAETEGEKEKEKEGAGASDRTSGMLWILRHAERSGSGRSPQG